MIAVASEKNISTAKKRDIAPFKVNGQSHIILQPYFRSEIFAGVKNN
jgi:hypothetical protein